MVAIDRKDVTRGVDGDVAGECTEPSGNRDPVGAVSVHLDDLFVATVTHEDVTRGIEGYGIGRTEP